MELAPFVYGNFLNCPYMIGVQMSIFRRTIMRSEFKPEERAIENNFRRKSHEWTKEERKSVYRQIERKLLTWKEKSLTWRKESHRIRALLISLFTFSTFPFLFFHFYSLQTTVHVGLTPVLKTKCKLENQPIAVLCINILVRFNYKESII